MDKYEYKIRVDEIRNLIAQNKYEEASEIADTIDWGRVKKAPVLCMISDLYKKVKRYEDAIELLQMADARYPGNKNIIFSMCELYLVTGDTIPAIASYKEFCTVAGNDIRRYILQYKVYEAQGVSLEERIEVLEELKKRDYRPKWAYTLAYLYHRIGLATKCIDECDNLILFFSGDDSEYVYMAMELKMLHQPLTPSQQQEYDNHRSALFSDMRWEQSAIGAKKIPAVPTAPNVPTGDTTILSDEEKKKISESMALSLGYTQVYHGNVNEPEINVKPMDVGEYNTINLQKALAEGIQEVLQKNEEEKQQLTPEQIIAANTKEIPQEEGNNHKPAVIEREDFAHSVLAPMYESDTEVIDVSQVNAIIASQANEKAKEQEIPDKSENIESAEENQIEVAKSEDTENSELEVTLDTQTEMVSESKDIKLDSADDEQVDSDINNVLANEDEINISEKIDVESQVVKEAITARPPEPIASVLTQEADGQISLVVPEKQQVVKQITGQLSIGDVMNEWARMKREHEELNRQQYHEQIKQQTGEIFSEFEAAALNGVLETLEKEAAESYFEESNSDTLFKSNDEALEVQYSENEETEVEEAEVSADFEEGVSPEYAEAEYSEDECAEGEVEYSETYDENQVEYSEAESPEYYEADSEINTDQEEIAIDSQPIAEEASEATDEVAVAENSEESSEKSDASILTRGRAVPDYYKKKIEAAEKSEEEDDEETENLRALTTEEEELFGSYIQSKSSKNQLIKMLDKVSLASYTGNIILTGGDGTDTSELATLIMKEIKQSDSNFSGKVARINANNFNNKKPANIIKQLSNGGLIIELASHLSDNVINEFCKCLDQENLGIVVVLIDSERNMEKLLERAPKLETFFNARMNIKPLSAEQLAEYAIKYAYDKEFSIDEMGILALHRQINVRQTSTHSVNVVEVREIVDDAIKNVKKKSLNHFFDVLFGKRYDNEDMIILGEKDFQLVS